MYLAVVFASMCTLLFGCFDPPQGVIDGESAGVMAADVPMVNPAAISAGSMENTTVENSSGAPMDSGPHQNDMAMVPRCRASGESCNTSDQCCDGGTCNNFACQPTNVTDDADSPEEMETNLETMPGDVQPIDEDTLAGCVQQMIGLFENIYERAGCTDYDVEGERMDQLMTSPYWREDVAASCMLFECEGCASLRGTSGFPAARSCSDLDDQMTILRGARTTAIDECECTAPVFKVRVLSLADLVGGEPCDQMVCRLGLGESVMVSE